MTTPYAMQKCLRYRFTRTVGLVEFELAPPSATAMQVKPEREECPNPHFPVPLWSRSVWPDWFILLSICLHLPQMSLLHFDLAPRHF